MDWCADDANAVDDRKIHYTLISHNWAGETKHEEFTSEDIVDYYTILKIRQSSIVDMILDGNDEWHFKLEYYGLY